MLRFGWIGLALGLVACTVHEVDECLPPCDELDEELFASCVAEGLDGVCRAGNRRCCALEAGCVGDLDDQTVRTTATCETVVQDACYPPCDQFDVEEYDFCLAMGTSDGTCGSGEDECCALAAGCLGELGDWIVSAEGCCSDSSECDAEQICDPEIFECVDAPAPECGNEVQEADEECDDGDTVVEPCPYGLVSCFVCSADCREIEGTTSFCGDGRIDEAEGERCDPPSADCDPSCGRIPPMCTSPDECPLVDECTTADCDPAMGCLYFPLDADGDDFGPGAACGGDCDDLDPNVFPGASEICGDRIDQNCDTRIDEGCP